MFSAQALDLLLNAPDHHDKNFLQLIYDGLKKNQHRFQYTCVLFYGLRRSPPASWYRRLTRHNAIKELLQGLDHKTHPTNLVAGIMVVIVLVTVAPHDVGSSCLGLILEMFWRMMHWEPTREQDSLLQDYLRATLYSLFTRLYTLFPCNVVNYLRTHTVGMTKTPFFICTLQPMIERVRLHPMLFTHTREQELLSLNAKLDNNMTLMPFSRLSLDPVESSCEEPPVIRDPEICTVAFRDSKKCWVHTSSDEFFWSPSHTQIPKEVKVVEPTSSSNINTPQQTPVPTPSIPKTPLKVDVSLSTKDSPEEAVEATPDNTPYSIPSLQDLNKHFIADGLSLPSLSPQFGGPPKFVKKESTSNGEAVKDPISSRLTALKLDRERFSLDPLPDICIKLDNIKSFDTIDETAIGFTDKRHNQNGHFTDKKNIASDAFNISDVNQIRKESETPLTRYPAKSELLSPVDHTSVVSLPSRYRKRPVYVPPAKDMLQFTAKVESATLSSDSATTGEDDDLESRRDTDTDKGRKTDTDEGRKTSIDTCDDEDGLEGGTQGLGPPPATSLLELVKSVKSNRLRFLSQCGPSLDAAQIESIMPDSIKTVEKRIYPRERSRSCDQIEIKDTPRTVLRKASFVSRSKALLIDSYNKETQTTSIPAFDPYEKLIDTFIATAKVPSAPTNDPSQPDSYPETVSPHILLENYIKRKVLDCTEPIVGFDFRKMRSGDENLKNQIQAMYCLLLLERQKREFHANRNRRLLAKSKRMHVLAEQQHGLAGKLESYQEQTRNLKSNNLYMSSCYERMKDTRDREKAERMAIVQEYAEGKELSSSAITSLTRTIKTSKGEDQNEKVTVILHKANEVKEDKLIDELYGNIASLDENLFKEKNEKCDLKLRICELEQAAAKCKIDRESIEVLKHEKEMMRQHMAIMKIQLTLKDELFLETSEQLSSLVSASSDLQSKYRLETETSSNIEEVLKLENRALQGVMSAVTLRLQQLEEQMTSRTAEHERELNEARQEADIQRNKVTVVEESMHLLRKQSRELEMRVNQVSGERDMLDKEFNLLANRSGYTRSAPTLQPNAPFNNFVSANLSSELKPLGPVRK